MSATYDPTLPADKDWVRFLIGDRGTPTGAGNNVSGTTLSDEEIAAVLAEEANKYLAAARCGETIQAQGHGATSKSVGDLSISYGDSPDSAYRKHLTRLRQKGAELLLGSDGKGKVFRVL